MAKLARRKDLDRVQVRLDDATDTLAAVRLDLEGRRAVDHSHHTALGRIQDTLDQHGERLDAIRADMLDGPSVEELERTATLLNGVKAALERMGGNSLPSALADILALRDQMGEFRQELAGYRSALMAVSKLVEGITMPAPQPKAWSKDYSESLPRDRPKRSYNRRKKSNPSHLQVEISAKDVAPHNNSDEDPDIKP